MLKSDINDDRAIAGIVGVILIFAVLVTVFATAAHTNVPAFGRRAELAWAATVATTFQSISAEASKELGSQGSTTITLPPPPTPESLSIPLLGRVEPSKPDGTLAFRPACTNVTVSHTVMSGASNATVVDLHPSTLGCLIFSSGSVYTPSTTYAMELGAVLRERGAAGVLVSGPPLTVKKINSAEQKLDVGLIGLRGSATSLSTGTTGVQVSLTAGPGTTEVEQGPNAANVTITLVTTQPAAWRGWFNDTFQQAGLSASRSSPAPGESTADYTVTCAPVDCSTNGTGSGTVTVMVEGPRIDTNDLRFSLSFGFMDVDLR